MLTWFSQIFEDLSNSHSLPILGKSLGSLFANMSEKMAYFTLREMREKTQATSNLISQDSLVYYMKNLVETLVSWRLVLEVIKLWINFSKFCSITLDIVDRK